MYGVDYDDCPVEGDDFKKLEGLLEDDNFLNALGVAVELFDEFNEFIEEQIENDEYYDYIPAYEAYARILLEPEQCQTAKSIMDNLISKYPQEADSIKKLLGYPEINVDYLR